MAEAYLAELMIDTFGEIWLQTGKLRLKFIRIVVPGDTITASAKLISKKSGGSTPVIDWDVWCENQRGEKVVIGTASGIAEL